MLDESPELAATSLRPFIADIGNFQDVQKAARKFISKEERLDILVNNAAVLARLLDKDANGISVSFGINQLGPFLLTKEFTPLLVKTESAYPEVRVVNVAPNSHYDVPQGAKFGSLDDFNNSYGSEDDTPITSATDTPNSPVFFISRSCSANSTSSRSTSWL